MDIKDVNADPNILSCTTAFICLVVRLLRVFCKDAPVRVVAHPLDRFGGHFWSIRGTVLPNPQASLLEHLLVDTHGAHTSGFANAVTPCKNYVNGAQTLGRETAAQWIRVAFHDFVTAHVVNGTGGIDASIGFETLREEDSGSAMNDSLSFFRPFANPKVSSEYFPLSLDSQSS